MYYIYSTFLQWLFYRLNLFLDSYVFHFIVIYSNSNYILFFTHFHWLSMFISAFVFVEYVDIGIWSMFVWPLLTGISLSCKLLNNNERQSITITLSFGQFDLRYFLTQYKCRITIDVFIILRTVVVPAYNKDTVFPSLCECVFQKLNTSFKQNNKAVYIVYVHLKVFSVMRKICFITESTPK